MDIRHRRNLGGMDLEVPAKVSAGSSFDIKLNPGNNGALAALRFMNQGGAWNQHYPESYQAQDLGVTVNGLDVEFISNKPSDYFAWLLEGFDAQSTEFSATVATPGRILFYVTRNEGNQRGVIETFLIDVE